ncbi:6310_t:CDS:2 [Gigaspora margarita]|uniref:NADPH--cytochrome P450 reductase n=1 Tax=Gigaspora margarita TaxID=4874 RepID=A0ABN7VJG7_GIGMA|nr:6310_t:CDS:2 [Gigaspora margarita]
MSEASGPVLLDPQDEPIIDTFDLVFLLSAGVIAVLYLFRDTLFGPKKAPPVNQPVHQPRVAPKKDKDFIKKMRNTDKNVVLFYGSQTGTAEDYASRLAKEGLQRFGLKTMTVDVEDCDMTLLDKFPEDCLAFFLMATYGEGEPTDDAVEFWELINSDNPEFSEGMPIEEKPLSKLRYVVFALGNKTYEHFNAVGRLVDSKLTEFGATRIGERGEGDDDGSLEEDFLGWKEEMWKVACDAMDIDPNEAQTQTGAHVAVYKITELENYEVDSVFYGELSENALKVGTRVAYDAKNPYPSPITASRELFSSTDRNCVHMELDIAGSGLYYQSGDHVAVWPMNPEQEVYRLLKVLGLWEKKDTIIKVESTDPTASKKYPFPVPTTYATIFRNYLDIHAPASRQFIATLANYAPTEEGKSRLTTLGQDKEAYKVEVADAHLTLGEVLELISSSSNGKLIESIPLDLIIETLPRLQCRYYSISSTSKVTPTSIHITASVLRYQPSKSPEKTVYGLATNYIHQVHRKLNNIAHPDTSPYYLYSGPRDKYYDESTNTVKFAIHVRNTNFKLPKNLKVPVVMVGPGTGVAPFRGFVIERARYKSEGDEVGDTVLFFGCRKRNEDFLYANEFEELFTTLGESGKLFTAFSREQDQKVYVQHRLLENQQYIWELIYTRAQACGGMDENSAIAYVKDLRSRGRYQEDVWS